MEAYSEFAELYDLFMDNYPYKKRLSAITKILKKHGIRDGLVCELGCGTGTFTRMLDAKGYDMIGIDSSEQMLQIAELACDADETGESAASFNAQDNEGEHDTPKSTEGFEKNSNSWNCGVAGSTDSEMESADGREETKKILYLNQDMRSFELYGTVRAFVSICNTMNYITSYEDMVRVLSLVNNYLDPGGIFVFDMDTIYEYKNVIGNRTIAEDREEASFIWDNEYDPESRLNIYDMTFFRKMSGDNYRRFDERHIQRAYTKAEMKRVIKAAGLEFLGVTDADSGKAPARMSETLLYVVREHGKALSDM